MLLINITTRNINTSDQRHVQTNSFMRWTPGHRQLWPRRLSTDDAAVECRRHRPFRNVRFLSTELCRTRRRHRDFLHPIFRRLRDFRHRDEDALVGGALEVAFIADAAIIFADRRVLT